MTVHPTYFFILRRLLGKTVFPFKGAPTTASDSVEILTNTTTELHYKLFTSVGLISVRIKTICTKYGPCLSIIAIWHTRKQREVIALWRIDGEDYQPVYLSGHEEPCQIIEAFPLETLEGNLASAGVLLSLLPGEYACDTSQLYPCQTMDNVAGQWVLVVSLFRDYEVILLDLPQCSSISSAGAAALTIGDLFSGTVTVLSSQVSLEGDQFVEMELSSGDCVTAEIVFCPCPIGETCVPDCGCLPPCPPGEIRVGCVCVPPPLPTEVFYPPDGPEPIWELFLSQNGAPFTSIGFTQYPQSINFQSGVLFNGAQNYVFWQGLYAPDWDSLSGTYHLPWEPERYTVRRTLRVVGSDGSVWDHESPVPSLRPIIPGTQPPRRQCALSRAVVKFRIGTRIGPAKFSFEYPVLVSDPYCGDPPPDFLLNLIRLKLGLEIGPFNIPIWSWPDTVSFGPVDFTIEDLGNCICP